MIEPGKKPKKVVAVAFDWPGWDRNGKREELKDLAEKMIEEQQKDIKALNQYASGAQG